MNILEVLSKIIQESGFVAMSWQQGVMILVSFTLLYLAIVKGFEPLLLLPIAFGMMLTNLPLTGMMTDAFAVPKENLLKALEGSDIESIKSASITYLNTHGYDSGILYNLYMGVKSGLFPALIFLGVGAMTDFGPLLANPISLFLGAAAQLGIYVAFSVAIGTGLFTPEEAASIAIIGGADGPTAIYLTSKLAPHLLGPIAVAAYSYMALIPIIQPPIMRALTTQKERETKMGQLRNVSKTERIVFPIVVAVICILLLPAVGALIGMLMLGNLFRESGVVDRLSDTAQNGLINIITIMLGVTVGATARGEQFLNPKTLGIIAIGLLAFAFSTAGGVLLGKLMYYVSGGKINPLIGSAGVSAVPMAARISQVEGQRANPKNFLLMHAMGANVSGVIGSAVAAGFLLILFGK